MKRFRQGQNPKMTVLLQALSELGGTATSRQVYERVKTERFDTGKRYMNWQDVSSYLSWMSRMDNPWVILASRSRAGSGKAGDWRITESGRKQLETWPKHT